MAPAPWIATAAAPPRNDGREPVIASRRRSNPCPGDCHGHGTASRGAEEGRGRSDAGPGTRSPPPCHALSRGRFLCYTGGDMLLALF